jgi:RNA polymerase sigma factor (TIGR02999 family)
MATKPPASGHEEGRSITAALLRLDRGDRGALDRLFPLIYDELRRLAHQRLRGERPGHTLDTTALVHEAYLRLSSQHRVAAANRAEFLAAASNTMRRVLVDYARARRRQKRGGGEAPTPLEAVEPFLSDRAAEETLVLDEALLRLEAAEPRAARVFEQRLFGGMSLDEIASVLGVSTKTVQRDWSAARAWLRKEVGRQVVALG